MLCENIRKEEYTSTTANNNTVLGYLVNMFTDPNLLSHNYKSPSLTKVSQDKIIELLLNRTKMATQTFHRFSALSRELRNAIWTFAAEEDNERVIVVEFCITRVFKSSGVLDYNFHCTSPTPLPITFQIVRVFYHVQILSADI